MSNSLKPSANFRDENTDLVRATAIALVIIHHLGQFQTAAPAQLLEWFRLGAHGVDLFFVLSGWLIGGLYWREHQQTGNVNILRFWGRRWLRTLPPYFAVLPIAYFTVWWHRNEAFDFGYLLFLQNYYDTMPFFFVSWSLSVEEHFYLALPLMLFVILRCKVNINAAFISIISLSMAARIIDPYVTTPSNFGYSITASHLNMSGLLLGVYIAYLSQHQVRLFNRLGRLSKTALLPTLLLFLCLPFLPESVKFYWQRNIVALVATVILLNALHTPALSLAKKTWVKKLALWSYSIYLSHAIVINAYVLISDKLGIDRWLMAPLCIVVIMLVGYTLYRLVEKPSMTYRDRWIPKLRADN